VRGGKKGVRVEKKGKKLWFTGNPHPPILGPGIGGRVKKEQGENVLAFTLRGRIVTQEGKIQKPARKGSVATQPPNQLQTDVSKKKPNVTIKKGRGPNDSKKRRTHLFWGVLAGWGANKSALGASGKTEESPKKGGKGQLTQQHKTRRKLSSERAKHERKGSAKKGKPSGHAN